MLSFGDGRYEIEAIVGAGASCTVYRAWDTIETRRCALKVLRGPSSGWGPSRERMEREVAALKRLDHPHILRVQHASVEADVAYLATDYAEEGSLADVLLRGPLAPARAARIGAQIGSALAAAHRIGLVHRDVKPGNILIVRPDWVVLADFGLVENMGRHGDSRVPIGSRAFRAPEQTEAPWRATPSADCYALAATVYALVTGGDPSDLHLAPDTSPRWGVLPPGLREILYRALRPSPHERTSSAATLSSSFLECSGFLAEVPTFGGELRR